MARAGRHADHRVTFLVLLVGVTAYSLLQSLVMPALPTIQRDLHTSQSAVTWLVTGYLLSASVFTPILGRIGDAVGKERMLVVTLGALAVGIALAGVANSIGLMIIARLIQGMGGGTLPLAFGIIRDEFPRDRVATGIGMIAAILAVGSGLGIVLAGPIVSHLGYHWLFWLPLVMTVVGAVATHLFVPESPVRAAGRVSWVAATLLSGWLVALLLGVSEGPRWGWASAPVLGLFVASAVLAAAWVRAELRARTPLVDMRMMRIPAVWTTNLTAILFGAALYAPMAFLPAFVQTPPSAGYGFGASITQSGVFMLPSTGGMFLFGLLAGRLARTVGSKLPVVVGSVVTTASFVLFAAVHQHAWEIYLASAAMGVGMGLAYSAMSNLIVDAVPPEQTGVASGMNANIRTIGGSIGSQVAAVLITSGAAVGGLPPESGYSHAFWFLAVLSAIAAVTAVGIPVPRPSRVVHHDHAELALVPAAPITDVETA